MRAVVNLAPRSERKISLLRAALDQFRPFGGEVRSQRFTGFAADWHESCLVSFAGHAHNPVFEIEILQPRICQLGNAQSARVKQLDHRPIAQPVRGLRVDLLQKLLDLQFVECLGEITLDPRERQRFSRIALDQAFSGQESEKNLQCNHNQFDRRGGKPGAFAVGEIFADERTGSRRADCRFFSLRRTIARIRSTIFGWRADNFPTRPRSTARKRINESIASSIPLKIPRKAKSWQSHD